MLREPGSLTTTLGLLTAFSIIVPISAGAGVVVVDENNLSWAFFVEGGVATSGFETGPDTPPLGSGSAFFGISGSSDAVAIGTADHNGTRLADLTVLDYCTYQNTTPQAISLQFNADYDDSDAATSWQGRLVYEPYYTESVIPGVWQCWDTLQASGNWWSSGSPIVGDTPHAATCTIGSPCSFATILATYPDIAIHQGALGAVLLKAGSGWPDAVQFSIDSLEISTQQGSVVYDFETLQIPVELLALEVE